MKLSDNEIYAIQWLIVGLIMSLTALIVHPEWAITLGGFLLMFGAVYVYFGKIFYSIMVYTIADVCWLVNAYQHGDGFGALTVTIGIIVGTSVVYKMQVGKFRKSIRKDNE